MKYLHTMVRVTDLDASLEDRQVGGLGIHLVKHFMDEYDYSYRDRHNVVTLKKRLVNAAD